MDTFVSTYFSFLYLGGAQFHQKATQLLPHHVFELVLTRVQCLPDALGQQDLVPQPLLAEGHGAAGDNHHLPALVLQHGHLAQVQRGTGVGVNTETGSQG